MVKKYVESGVNKKMKKTFQDDRSFDKKDLADFVVFDRTKDSIGGNVRAVVSAQAPLSQKIQEFLTICYSCDIINAYGLTENGGASTSTRVNDRQSNHIGGPM